MFYDHHRCFELLSSTSSVVFTFNSKLCHLPSIFFFSSSDINTAERKLVPGPYFCQTEPPQKKKMKRKRENLLGDHRNIITPQIQYYITPPYVGVDVDAWARRRDSHLRRWWILSQLTVKPWSNNAIWNSCQPRNLALAY